MFFARDVCCMADVSSVGLSSEQTNGYQCSNGWILIFADRKSGRAIGWNL